MTLDFVASLVLILRPSMREVSLSEAEFKEFELRLKFKSLLKYGWFHLKLNSKFQDLSRHSI